MTPVELGILRTLAEYRFLTVPQFQRLGVARDRKHLGEKLRAFDRRGLIGMKELGVYPGLGRLPRMYYLRRIGADALAEFERRDRSEIPFQPNKPKFQVDHIHRRQTVDFHISADLWARDNGRDVGQFIAYYMPPPPRVMLTGGKALLPDAYFEMAATDGVLRPYVVEVARDSGGTDKRRILAQLAAHRIAIQGGLWALAYGHKKDNRVLSIFERQASLDAVRAAMAQSGEYAGYEAHFLFATLEESGDVGGCWLDMSGAATAL